MSKPGVELVRKLRKDESAELGLSLFGCKDDGSADAARGVVSTARACSGAEKATLARLTADPGAPGSLGTSVEVPSLRGPASKVFVNPDGTKTVRLFQNTVHSRAANGEWVDANPTVRLDPNGGKGLIADGVDGITRFSAVTGDGPLVGFEPSGPGADRLAFGLEGAAAGVKAEVRGQSVLYRDVFAGVDVQVDQQPLSAKGSVILKRGGTPSVFRFPLDAATGSTARVEGRNVIVSNSKGVQVGVFATPAVFVPGSSMAAAGGSANLAPATDSGLTVKVETGRAGALTIVVSVDATWLGAPERKFPVVIDPTLSTRLLPGGAADAMVFESSDSWHGPNSPQDYLLSYDDYGWMYYYLIIGGFQGGRTRDYFKYDLSSIAGRTIVSAFWTPTGTIYGWPSTTYQLQPVTGGAWSPATLTWNNQPAVNPAASVYGTFVRGASGPSTDITAIVQEDVPLSVEVPVVIPVFQAAV